MVAKYLGEFEAGFPSGTSNFAATSGAISCSWNPKRSAVSDVLRRPGNRRQFSTANFSCVVAEERLASISPLSFRLPMDGPPTTDETNQLNRRTELSAKSPAVPSTRDR